MYKDIITGKEYKTKEEYIKGIIQNRKERLSTIEKYRHSTERPVFQKINQIVSLAEQYQDLKDELTNALLYLKTLYKDFTPDELGLWNRCLASYANELCS